MSSDFLGQILCLIRFCIDCIGIRFTSMVGLAAMGLAVISIGNMFFQPLLYLDEIVLTIILSFSSNLS